MVRPEDDAIDKGIDVDFNMESLEAHIDGVSCTPLFCNHDMYRLIYTFLFLHLYCFFFLYL